MKKWYMSKTIWMGALAIGEATYHAIESGLDIKSILLAGFGAAFIYLRFITDSKITKL